MGTIFKLAAKRYTVWLGILALEILLILYLLNELRMGASPDILPVNYLKRGLFVNSYALPASCMGVYGVLWLEDFFRRRIGFCVACGIERSTLYYGKCLFGLLWIGLSMLFLAGGLYLEGCLIGKDGISGADLYSVLPMLILYFSIVVFLNGLCALCGILFKNRTEGLIIFGSILFLWDRWSQPFGTDRIYDIAFAGDWASAWKLTAVLLAFSACFYLSGAVLVKKIDI